MPTNTVFRRRTWQPSLNDWEIVEALHLSPTLIPTEGFPGKVSNGERIMLNRDWEAIALAWQAHGDELVLLWVEGWVPSVRFVDAIAEQPGVAGTRPKGWWRYRAPEPKRRREPELAYLARHGLLLDGESEAAEAYARRSRSIKRLVRTPK